MVKYVLVDVEKLPESPEQLVAKVRTLGNVEPVLIYDVCGIVTVFDERFNEHWVRDFEEEEDAEEVMLGFARHVRAEWLVHLYDGDRGAFAIASCALRLAPLQRVGAKTYRFAGRLDLENLSPSDEAATGKELKEEVEKLVQGGRLGGSNWERIERLVHLLQKRRRHLHRGSNWERIERWLL